MTRANGTRWIAAGIAACALLVPATADAIQGRNGTWEISITPATSNDERDDITISYRPDSGKAICADIRLIQVCTNLDQAGIPVPFRRLKTGSSHLLDDEVGGGTVVDHLVCEKDPYYNGTDAGKDRPGGGWSDSTTQGRSSMTDSPNLPDAVFPDGVTRLQSMFEVCAVCSPGDSVFDCIGWSYTRDLGSGGKGTIALRDTNAALSSFKEALEKFDELHGQRMRCPELTAETHQGQPNLGTGLVLKTPHDPPLANQPGEVRWDVVNTSTVAVGSVPWRVDLDGAFLMQGMTPLLEPFTGEPLIIPLPGLSPGPHVLSLIVDPYADLVEYDEDDNSHVDEFLVEEVVVGVPREPARGFGILAVGPNPARTVAYAAVALRGDTPARLELIDASGRRVRDLPVDGGGKGTMRVRLDLGPGVPAGVYVLRLSQGGAVSQTKLTVVR
jgi:hypothetical protein